MSERAIHIHEDDWGMCNLYPVGALFEARAEVTRAADAADRSRAPDGGGFIGMHVINGPSIDYADIGLGLGVLADALGSIVPRVKRFTATAMAGFEPNTRDGCGQSRPTKPLPIRSCGKTPSSLSRPAKATGRLSPGEAWMSDTSPSAHWRKQIRTLCTSW